MTIFVFVLPAHHMERGSSWSDTSTRVGGRDIHVTTSDDLVAKVCICGASDAKTLQLYVEYGTNIVDDKNRHQQKKLEYGTP